MSVFSKSRRPKCGDLIRTYKKYSGKSAYGAEIDEVFILVKMDRSGNCDAWSCTSLQAGAHKRDFNLLIDDAIDDGWNVDQPLEGW